jgi:hypothetical protein
MCWCDEVENYECCECEKIKKWHILPQSEKISAMKQAKAIKQLDAKSWANSMHETGVRLPFNDRCLRILTEKNYLRLI